MDSKRLVHLGLLFAAVALAGCSSAATPVPTATMPPLTATTAAAPTTVPSTAEVPMGFTEDGAPYRGDPTAPVTLVEHSEFL